MSISSLSSNPLYLPSLTVPADTSARQDSQRQQHDSVQLSDRAKQLLTTQLEPKESKEKGEEGKESVQISSSIGRLSRVTGLQREEVAALYRSIDKLT
ncbi:hypothetical protein [Marinomonas rhizomae]|uniref:hypothetical protein n=1 Tax=Marinomonas rhizomae TaxID=491948 RepID=UPI0011BF6B3D|nr:hypothetical protein [Marinomonas rhizomae]